MQFLQFRDPQTRAFAAARPRVSEEAPDLAARFADRRGRLTMRPLFQPAKRCPTIFTDEPPFWI